VIYSSHRTRGSLDLEIPDSIRRKSSLVSESEHHSSADVECDDSSGEYELPAQPAKRRRVSSQLSTCSHHCRSMVSVPSTRSSADSRPRRMSTPDQDTDTDKGGEGTAPGFVRRGHTENGGESEQDGCLGSSLLVTSHASMSAGEAMTLAAAVAHELYSLLMRPAVGAVAGSHEESGSPLAGAGYEERMSDQGGKRARWSEADDRLLLSLRRGNVRWEEIEKRFPRRTLGSLRQRCSTLNNRSRPSKRSRRRCRQSE
jgi:hypothetical protein